MLEETARLLADLGHDVREVDPHYPDPTAAFVPQFFAGIRTEADAVEHFERLERRTRETYRLGSWVTSDVIERAITAGEKIAAKVNRVFDGVDVLMTPTMAHRPPRGRASSPGRGRSAPRCGRCRRSPTPRCGTSPATRLPRCPCGLAEDGLPTAVQLVGRPTTSRR